MSLTMRSVDAFVHTFVPGRIRYRPKQLLSDNFSLLCSILYILELCSITGSTGFSAYIVHIYSAL